MEVPEEHMGAVVELLGKRRGQMFNMENFGYVINANSYLFCFSDSFFPDFVKYYHVIHVHGSMISLIT